MPAPTHSTSLSTLTSQEARLSALASPACQKFYASPPLTPPAWFDADAEHFRPLTTLRADVRVRRMWTYEDLAPAAAWERLGAGSSEPFVMPLWVRTAQRAVKSFFEPPTSSSPLRPAAQPSRCALRRPPRRTRLWGARDRVFHS